MLAKIAGDVMALLRDEFDAVDLEPANAATVICAVDFDCHSSELAMKFEDFSVRYMVPLRNALERKLKSHLVEADGFRAHFVTLPSAPRWKEADSCLIYSHSSGHALRILTRLEWPLHTAIRVEVAIKVEQNAR